MCIRDSTNTVGTYTVTYTATDLDNNTATATRTVSVVDTTAPVITSSSTFVAPENQTAIGTVTATDLDTVTFSVSGSDLSITSSGVLTFVVAPDNENYSTITATVTATDASSNATTQQITVNVSDVDDEAPTFASANTFTAAENQTTIGYVIASDVDTDDSNITFSVSGDSRVTIESAGNGAITSGGTAALLSFTAAPDNENYTTAVVTVTATDLAGNSSSQTVTVNVSDVDDEAPSVTSSATFVVEENQTTIGYVIATDVDSDDSNITFSVSGDSRVTIESRGSASITSAGNAALMTFTTAPDNENYTTAVVTVTVTDEAGNSSSQTVTINAVSYKHMTLQTILLV